MVITTAEYPYMSHICGTKKPASKNMEMFIDTDTEFFMEAQCMQMKSEAIKHYVQK